MDVGKIVAQRRKELGITQIELAELASVGIATVKDLERGKGNPSLKTLESICTVLGYEMEFKIRKVGLGI